MQKSLPWKYFRTAFGHCDFPSTSASQQVWRMRKRYHLLLSTVELRKRENPGDEVSLSPSSPGGPGVLTIWQKNPVEVSKTIMVSDLPVYRRIAKSVTVWIQKKGRICVDWVWNREGTEKLVNDKQHSVWFELTTSKCTLQFSVGISEKWSYHLPSRPRLVPIFPQRQ